METVDSVQWHPTTDMLEEYAFSRLSQVDSEAMEEHLFVCPECQTSLIEVDEYILLMKHVTAQFERSAPTRPRRWGFTRIWEFAKGWRPTPSSPMAYGLSFVLGITLLAAFLLRPLAPRPTASTSIAESVQLVTLRGGGSEQEAVNRAHAGRPLDLTIDVAGLAVADRYRVEIVNSVGKPAWDGETAGSQNSLRVHVAKTFTKGQYWVRLYSSGELRREFGLQVE